MWWQKMSTFAKVVKSFQFSVISFQFSVILVKSTGQENEQNQDLVKFESKSNQMCLKNRDLVKIARKSNQMCLKK